MALEKVGSTYLFSLDSKSIVNAILAICVTIECFAMYFFCDSGCSEYKGKCMIGLIE